MGACNPKQNLQNEKEKNKADRLQSSIRSSGQKTEAINEFYQKKVRELLDFFERELEELNKMTKNNLSDFENQQRQCDVQSIGRYPFNSLNKVYEEAARKPDQIEKINHFLKEPYILLCKASQDHKRFIKQMEYFLKVIQKTIEKGYHQDDSNYQHKKQEINKYSGILVRLIENNIRIATQSYKKERSRILVEELSNHPDKLEENQELRAMLDKLKGDIKSIEELNRKLEFQNSIFQNKTQPSLKSKINQLELNIKIMQETYKQGVKQSQSETKSSNFKADIEEKDKTIEEYRKKIKFLEQKASEYESKLQQMSKSIKLSQEFESDNKKLAEEKIQYEQQILSLKSKNQEILLERENLLTQNKQYERKIEVLYQEKNGSEKTAERQKRLKDSLISELESKIVKLQRQIDEQSKLKQAPIQKKSDIELPQQQLATQKIKDIEKKLQQKSKEGQELKQNLQTSEATQQKLKQSFQELKRQKQQFQRRYEQALSDLKNLRYVEKELIEKKYQLQEVKELNMKISEDLEEYRNNSSRYRTKSFVQQQTLFIGDVLQQKKYEKRFLVEKITQLMKRSINKTKKLYQFKLDQKLSFHERIDNHTNLVIIIETLQGNLIASFYSGKYAEKTAMTSEALMFSLTNKQCFTLNTLKHNPKKDKKDARNMYGMVYDKYFLIFGNSQIRIKSGEKKIFSNFGINNAYFFSRGQTVDTLLGQGKKNQVQLQNYEIHEVYFDDYI